MAVASFGPGASWQSVVDAAVVRAEGWIAALRADPSAGTGFLRGMRSDPDSFEFTRRMLELVAGTQDAIASAVGLRDIAQEIPESLPAADRLAVRAGGATSVGLPWAVMPIARQRLRDRVADLVLATKLPTPGRPSVRLIEALRGVTDAGQVPVVVPLGDPVHGPRGAAAEATRLIALAQMPTVRHLVVDPARLAPGGSDWSAEDDAARLALALRPLLEAVADGETVVHLHPPSVRWARLVPEALERALDGPGLEGVRVGVRLMAELPEAREHYDRLYRWARVRVAAGGAPAEVEIGVAGVAGAERIASIESGLAVPVLEGRDAVTAQFIRLADLALHAGRAAVLRPVIATEDPFLLAASIERAAELGSTRLLSLQLRSGIASGLAEQVLAERTLVDEDSEPLVEMRLSLPIVAPREFAGAVDLLVAFAAEAADPDSVIARYEALANGDETLIEGEREAFRSAVELAAKAAPGPHRTQLRASEWDPSVRDSALFYRAPDEPARFDTGGLTAAVLGLGQGETGEVVLEPVSAPLGIPVVSVSGFANEPDTDASLAPNRAWVRMLLERASSDLDGATRAPSEASDGGADAQAAGLEPEPDRAVELAPASLPEPVPERVPEPETAPEDAAAREAARAAARQWSGQPARSRASRLRRAGLAAVAARDRLLQTLALDTGAPVPALDADVNELVDLARYYGQLAEGLSAVRGASFESERMALVVADESVPFTAQAEAVFAALAAGSAVQWVVPRRVLRTARALLEECQVGGIAAGAVRLRPYSGAAEAALEAEAAPAPDRAIVLGDHELAREIARLRPGLQVDARLHALGSVLVTQSAEIDLAVDDVVRSAFARAGADPRAVSMVVLLGGPVRARRFLSGLADAVRALRAGDTSRPGDADPLSFDVGPLPVPPSEAGLRALTELHRGEEWLVQPRRLDDEGRLWSPGVRIGVSAASPFWSDARGMPVIGVAHAHTFEQALKLQNAPGSGVAAGLQANDPDEILRWCDQIEAASIAINRPTTAARIERHPGGAWNDAAMGFPTLSGGPNRLLPLGSWRLREGTRSDTLHLRGLDPEVQRLIGAAQEVLVYEEFDEVRRACLADALAWRTSFGIERDTIGLGIERNAIRYVPVVTQIRLAEGGGLASLVRVLAAALLVRAPVSISTGEVLPAEVAALLEQQGVEVSLERDEDWLERVEAEGPLGPSGATADRVRLIGGDAERAAQRLGGLDRTALWAQPVTMAGPVELLTLLREQAVSARAHRHGLAVPVPGLDEIVER